jgi:ABC-type nitrate/sulfonate/bicarbonate transport system substrate-binding protein
MFTPGLSDSRLADLTILAVCVAALHGTGAQAQDSILVRIGWQPTTTVEAQIAHVLQRTNILERNGFKGQFTMFSFGPAVNEALVSGALDIGFIGDMPSVSLAAVNAPITVIGRQSVFRGAIVASTKSDIKTLGRSEGQTNPRTSRELHLSCCVGDARKGKSQAGYRRRGD